MMSDNRKTNRRKRSRGVIDIIETENDSVYNLTVTIFEAVPKKNIIKLQASRKVSSVIRGLFS